MPTRPLVVVTGRRLEGEALPWPRNAYASPQAYADGLARAGARPVLLPPVRVGIDRADWMDGVDGLLLTGGADVDPELYGEEPHPLVYGVDPDVDRLELVLLRAALDRGLPVLAICRGAQLLNVALGGTLHQHITDVDHLHDHGVPTDVNVTRHDVHIEPASRLAEALGVETATITSIHHQAIEVVADGMRVTAVAPDGLVEAIEPRDPDAAWVVGVQWHPEWTADRDPIQQRLFARFVAQTADRSALAAPLG